MLTSARRYSGSRPTVASGIARLGASERPFPLTCVAYRRLSGSDRGAEGRRIDRDLEQLVAVDRDDGDPDPVLPDQRVVALDVDLDEVEGRRPADVIDHAAGLVAQVTAVARIQDDAGHGCQDTDAMAVQDTDDDLGLHRRLAAGDRTAFNELYRRYAAQAYGLAYRVTGQQML